MRYELAVPQMRRVAPIMALLTASLLGVPAIAIAELFPRLAWATVALGIAMSVLLSAIVLRRSKTTLRAGLETMLREEAADEWWRLRGDAL